MDSSILDYTLSSGEQELILEISKQDDPTKTLLLEKLPWGITKLNSYIRILKDKRIIETSQGENNRENNKKQGRKPDVFHFRPALGYFLGLQLDICYDEYTILDFNGNVVVAETLPVTFSQDVSVEKIVTRTTAFIEKSGIPKEQILAMGLSSAVQFNKPGSSTFRSPSFSFEVLDTLYPKLQKAYPFPVYYGRPQVLICYKEFRNDLIYENKNFINILISDNVGVAIFINGTNYLGHSGLSGDLGHLKVPGNKLACYCGGSGCLRTMVSFMGICREAKRRLEEIGLNDGATSIDGSLLEGPDYGRGVEMLVKRAVEHDTFAVKLIHDTATQLGNAAATIVSLLNPEYLIISSLLNYTGDVFSDRIRSIIRTNCLGPYYQPLKIMFNDYSLSDIAEGSALFAQNAYLKEHFTIRDDECGGARL